MFKNLSKYLDESNKQFSLMRLLSLKLFYVGIGIAIVILYLALFKVSLIPIVINNVPIYSDISLIKELIFFDLGIFTISLGLKSVQKFAERSLDTTNTESKP